LQPFPVPPGWITDAPQLPWWRYQMLTQERLKQFLHYNPETGEVTWVIGRGNQFSKAGGKAGYCNADGYLKVELSGKAYSVHRLAFLYMTGAMPAAQVDHINGKRDDNRWSNLREASHSLNMQNRRKAVSTNTTGFLGVRKNCKGFLASITVNGQRRNLGTYSTPQEAHEVYLREKRKVHPGNTL